MTERDIFHDFTEGKKFDQLLNKVISDNLQATGLFGYSNYRSLERAYLTNFPDGRFTTESTDELSNVSLLKNYLNFVNDKVTIRNFVRVISIINKRAELIDMGLTIGQWHDVSSWDLASNDVVNVGKEARLLLLHKILNGHTEKYMFNLVSTEYIRSTIEKYERMEYSKEAVDLICSLPVRPEDKDFVYLLFFSIFTFTCIKSYGSSETNSKVIADVALQLCGTGILTFDYYCKRIYDTFKDVDVLINYTLISSIYGNEEDYTFKQTSSILNVNLNGYFKHSLTQVFKHYFSKEDKKYDIDNIYYKIIASWKDSGVWAKGDIRDDIGYLGVLSRTDYSDGITKTLVDSEDIILPHFLFAIMKSILEIDPELESSVSLYDLRIVENELYGGIFEDVSFRGRLRSMFSSSFFRDLPSWKHCLLIMLYLNVACKLPIAISRENLTKDLKEQIDFYYNLYKDVGSGKELKFMLSP